MCSESEIIAYSSFICKFRIISPALVAPDAFDLFPLDLEPSRKTRRNLVLLTTLFRKCGTGKLWGTGNYMSCLNPIIEKIHPQLLSISETVTKLPCQSELKHFSQLNKPKTVLNYDFSSLLDLHLLFTQ